MESAIFEKDTFVRGFANFSEGIFTKRAIHDGDTVSVVPDGKLSIRFLGIDTPEISFELPSVKNNSIERTWSSIEHFGTYLTNPFDSSFPDSDLLKNKLGDGLMNYLKGKLDPETAFNHYTWGKKAREKLQDIIKIDFEERKNKNEVFRFFMAFSSEVMDRYGRFLCYLDRDNKPVERQERITYNENMIKSGFGVPYFIWPNVDPFIKFTSIVQSVPDIDDFQHEISKGKRLNNARQLVSEARNKKIGVFDSQNPLKLLPFELRFLARRASPDRYILDLTARKPKLLSPTDYWKISNEEDRLFVPAEYVPLFKERGYDVLS